MFYHFFGNTNVFVRPSVVNCISLFKNSAVVEKNLLVPSLLVWYCACFSMSFFLHRTFIFDTTKHADTGRAPTFSICSGIDDASPEFIPFRILKNISQDGLNVSIHCITWKRLEFCVLTLQCREGKTSSASGCCSVPSAESGKAPCLVLSRLFRRCSHVEIKRSQKV